jgi:hypothetical protein
MYTCAHRATCCKCVCVLRVLARFRDAGASLTAVLWIVAVVTGRVDAPVVSWSFSIVGLSCQPGVRWTPGMVLCLSPGRFRRELDVVFGIPTASGYNEDSAECSVSTKAGERLVLHIRGIDTSTLSPECQ